MIILAVDPGIAITGYGLIESDGDKVSFKDCGSINTSSESAAAERLRQIYNEIMELIDIYKPDEVVVEKLFFNANVETAMSVGQAKGVILLAAATCGLLVFEYTPLQVKQAVAGYGRAEKRQIQEMVKMLLSLPKVPKPDDAADALAAAICHVHSKKMGSLLGAHLARSQQTADRQGLT